MIDRTVRVLIADPLPLYRDALGRMVRQDRTLTLTSEAVDGRTALLEIEERRPDVAVVGVPLGDIAAERLVDAIARDGLPTRVVLLMTEADAVTAFGTLARGAAGCLTRAVDEATLRRAITSAARGETVLAPEFQTGIAREIRRRTRDSRPSLSVREREILTHVAADRCTADIAGALRIRESTVKTHIANASEKLGVSSRAAAVAAAIRVGLVD
jgi:two-component system, NarL family, nitrate/nitrite response regulator NarL